jgi:asparagine synthetase B (glutamine-hydrolysing)
MGHSRLTTHGSELLNANNQPVQGNGFTVIHNGIVTNWRQLWGQLQQNPKTELDTEVLPALLSDNTGSADHLDIEGALSRLRGEVEGTVSIALLHRASKRVWLYTNHGSLYWAKIDQVFAFASESRFLSSALAVPLNCAVHVAAGEMVAVDLTTGEIVQRVPNGYAPQPATAARVEIVLEADIDDALITQAKRGPDIFLSKNWSRFEIDWQRVRELRRCSRGILPQTMPYIEFDEHGVSNYTHHYIPYRPKGEAELQELIERHKDQHGRRCLVAFSGGRDSSYALSYMKRMGLEPLAYTYDWGMVTDLARRNQARLCGKLGVEHIIVSANIRAKRDNIYKNVLAWLKRPHLGSVPLFMAGDKQYFFHANQLRKAYGLEWVVLAANPLERTYFKSGFAGMSPTFVNRPNKTDQLRLLAFYGGEFLRNPAYLNSSLLDTASAFLSYYTIRHDHMRIFDYLQWNEDVIDAELKAEFDWEHAADTKTTWRIGDGTAAFYNFIFMQVAGFSENDTLRHNQSLEGMITREQALTLAERDNQPRFESIEWYCRTVGLDPIQVLERVCAIPKLYDQH